MRIVQELESYPPDAAAAVVALGAFDGIHLGHRAILGTAVARGKARGIQRSEERRVGKECRL